jgi:16S rRNA (adenine1518-N6/adenine1519-N6)-dimethyltransferase
LPTKKNKNNNITKALGQHMLVDQLIVEKIFYAAQISNCETVLEAGTGQGILTARLCKAAKHVVSYEIDSKLYRRTREQLYCSLQFNNLELVNADIFRTKCLNFFDVFVSNLPYSRSRDAFEWLSTQKFGRAIVMVQDEFADKLTATPGSKNYRAISVLSAYCFVIEKLFKVRKHSFEPQPKVESTVIKVIPINTVAKEIVKKINLIFSKRNKRVESVVAEAGIINNIINANYENKRIDELEPRDLVRIAESMPNVHSIR